jgi:NAD+ diphosphatase
MLYTHGTLDRADHLRKDERAMRLLRARSDARLLPVWQGTVLVSVKPHDGQLQMATLARDVEVPAAEPVFLGLVDGAPYFAINCNTLDDTACSKLASLASGPNAKSLTAEFADLRIAGPNVPINDAALLAFARAMVYWHEHTRYCDRCGHLLKSCNAGHVLQCTNSDCAHPVFPRTDPAVIMLVTYRADADTEPLCLLGRGATWPPGVYSTLAGFVEPGESLEQAVRREVFEESAIRTQDVHYIASQPWPFPRSIMLGFEVNAVSTNITIDPGELEDARWFTRNEIKAFGNWGDDRYARQLPRHDSIARFLIDRWMKS